MDEKERERKRKREREKKERESENLDAEGEGSSLLQLDRVVWVPQARFFAHRLSSTVHVHLFYF